MRAFSSFISTSVEAPTLMTQIPPKSLPIRSRSLSTSYPEPVWSIWALIWAMRASTASSSPPPPMMVVFLAVTVTSGRVA